MLTRFVQTWFWLTTPKADLSPQDKQEAQLVSAALLLVTFFGVGLSLVLGIGGAQENVIYKLLYGLFYGGLFSIPYLISRTKYYKLGAYTFAFLFFIAILTSMISGQDDNPQEVLFYLIVPIALFSVILPMRQTVWITGASLTLCIFVIQSLAIQESLETAKNALVFTVLVSLVLGVGMAYRDWIRKRGISELEANEERYRSLLELAFGGVAVIDNGVVVQANKGFTNLFFNSDSVDVEGKQLTEFIPEASISYLQNILHRENVVEMTGEHEVKGDVDLGLLVNEQMYNGRLVHAIAVRDMTEQKAAEAALRRAQRLDSIGVLAGGIAHDFNNMLTGIVGQNQIAKLKAESGEPNVVNIDRAIVSAGKAADLTRQLLAYAGKVSYQVQTINLNDLIKENHGLFEATLPQKVAITYMLSPRIGALEADSGQIQQVVMNLVINAGHAVQATGRGGTIHVETTPKQIQKAKSPATIAAEPLATGDYVHLSVTDTGIGMNAETLARIFEPFFSTKSEGRGLGLAATMGVIRSHGGGMNVTSKQGVGTTFNVYFPVSQRRIVEEPELVPIENKLKGTILVVDDREYVLETAKENLELAGFDVLTALSGIEGVNLYQRHQNEIEATLLDIQMPTMDGIEVLEYIKRINKDARVVLSSGYTDANIDAEMKRFPNVTFLAKPYTLEDLLTKLNLAAMA